MFTRTGGWRVEPAFAVAAFEADELTVPFSECEWRRAARFRQHQQTSHPT